MLKLCENRGLGQTLVMLVKLETLCTECHSRLDGCAIPYLTSPIGDDGPPAHLWDLCVDTLVLPHIRLIVLAEDGPCKHAGLRPPISRGPGGKGVRRFQTRSRHDTRCAC